MIPANTRPLDGPAPRLKAPAGSTDCHMHFYMEGFEAQPGGPPIAELATPQDYARVQRRLGLERVVITQSNAYQFDNGSTLAALDILGPEKARAIIALKPGMAEAQLAALHARGVRGGRVMNLPQGATPIAAMKPVEEICRAMGWSLIVQFNARGISEHLDALRAIGTNYVIDHFGKFLPPVPDDDPRVDEILRLMDRGNAWFKLAGANEVSRTGAPDFADVAPLARRVIDHAPERILWGSNWPHVGTPRTAYPDDATLLDTLADWASEAEQRRILVDNPAELYGF
ncbi:amidohydrolase family protein [Solirhodobacter olei]|uniref:amidohydrolase family protein n=1 Tax=Solirhodobacter olei TaxID=2493082 RepID=UPI000FD9BA27|nr:amidohydrolase family protein [Solirhodobacter olei]